MSRLCWLSLVLVMVLSGCRKTVELAWRCEDPGTRNVDVGEVMLDVQSRGCGTPLLLLHGFPEFSFTWDPVAAELEGDFRVVTPDQRGFHRSDAPDPVEAYRVERLVADARGLVAAIGDEPAVVVGHDWGGPVAWLLAHWHPELVRGLVVINGPHPDIFARELQGNPDQVQAAQYMNLFLNPLAESLLGANDHQLLIDSFDGLLTAAEEQRYREAYAASNLTGMLNWYRANIVDGPAPPGDWPTGVTITVPTLVMWGLQDGALLETNLDGLDAYVSDLRVERYAASGHWLPLQEPRAVADSIRRFVGGLPAR